VKILGTARVTTERVIPMPPRQSSWHSLRAVDGLAPAAARRWRQTYAPEMSGTVNSSDPAPFAAWAALVTLLFVIVLLMR